MDDKIKVSEFLEQQGVEVNDFVRYELGEINDEWLLFILINVSKK